jgi:hypothetical protein
MHDSPEMPSGFSLAYDAYLAMFSYIDRQIKSFFLQRCRWRSLFCSSLCPERSTSMMAFCQSCDGEEESYKDKTHNKEFYIGAAWVYTRRTGLSHSLQAHWATPRGKKMLVGFFV